MRAPANSGRGEQTPLALTWRALLDEAGLALEADGLRTGERSLGPDQERDDISATAQRSAESCRRLLSA
eukprot:6985446-Alexandrium_andersonii.AAC.1